MFALLKELKFLLAFASGIPIMSTMMFRPNAMFYPGHLEALMHAWPDPNQINVDHFPRLWASGKETLRWLREHVQMEKFLGDFT